MCNFLFEKHDLCATGSFGFRMRTRTRAMLKSYLVGRYLCTAVFFSLLCRKLYRVKHFAYLWTDVYAGGDQGPTKSLIRLSYKSVKETILDQNAATTLLNVTHSWIRESNMKADHMALWAHKKTNTISFFKTSCKEKNVVYQSKCAHITTEIGQKYKYDNTKVGLL